MSSRSVRGYFHDILDCIAAIVSDVGDMGLPDYQADRKTRHAVERELQILTEAVFRLGDDAPRYCPDIPWGKLRGMGNFLRHEYDAVDDTLVWDVVQNRLPEIELAVRQALLLLDQEGVR